VKAGKGSVVIQSPGGRLRLVWTFNRKRHFMALNLADNPVARVAAEKKALTIQNDLISGNFDETLQKYKLPQAAQPDRISVVAVFKNFMEFKAKNLDPDTMINYRALLTHLTTYFKEKQFAAVTEVEANLFRDYLKRRMEPRTIQGNLCLIRACWRWQIKKGKMAIDNPWDDVRIIVPPKQKPQPFTKDEMSRIVKGFETNPKHLHYLDFVAFLLGTGCRTGEARGLLWRHISDDCRMVWIGQSSSRGKQKAAKMNKSRSFTLSPRLQKMLTERRPSDCDPDGIVFPSPQGKPMNAKNFCDRSWKEVLETQGVAYRQPYDCRSTYVSHALSRGVSPPEIAAITGHTIKVLFRDYASHISSHPMSTDILD